MGDSVRVECLPTLAFNLGCTCCVCVFDDKGVDELSVPLHLQASRHYSTEWQRCINAKKCMGGRNQNVIPQASCTLQQRYRETQRQQQRKDSKGTFALSQDAELPRSYHPFYFMCVWTS